MNIYIDLDEIEPLHEVRDQELVTFLAEDMMENGWTGRPLLVIDRGNGYLAWTGTHRIAAARQSNFQAVPCYVIDDRKLTKHGIDAAWGHVDDWERLNLLKKIGDKGAISLMWQEGRS